MHRGCYVWLAIVFVFVATTEADDLVTLHTAVDPTDYGDRYIVAAEFSVPLSTVGEKLEELKKNESLKIEVIWKIETALKFLYVQMNKPALDAVRQLTEEVVYIEQDCWLSPQTGGKIDVEVSPDQWGLDRIDQRNLPLDNVFSLADNAGTSATVYVIDTGIHVQHEDFGGRATNIYDFRGEDETGRDCNGHGTILASVAAGKKYGVAKNATIYGLRVTKCRGVGRMSDSVKAIAWLASNSARRSVALFGLSSPGPSPSIDNALHRLYTTGVVVVVPAGNDNGLACDFSPARGQGPITVGATTVKDYSVFYNNKGKCVDIFAPGKTVLGAFYEGTKTATASKSGTSIAAAYVTGAAAYHLGNDMPMGKVKGFLLRHATEDQIHQLESKTPNKMLFVGKVSSIDDYERVVKAKVNKKKKEKEDVGKDKGEKGEGKENETADANAEKAPKTEL